MGLETTLFLLCIFRTSDTISSNSFLRYYAMFDGVMYPTPNHTLGHPSHVTLETCAELCFNKPLQHNIPLKRNLHTRTMGNFSQSEHCSAFEYIHSIGYCIQLRQSAFRDVDGYQSLKQAKGTTYFELSKSVLNIYTKKGNAVLAGNNAYQKILNDSSATDCVRECIMAPDFTCNSFAYSERMRICATSSHVSDGETSLQMTASYDFYQYSGVWPCNVTLYWGYTPRVLGSPKYPYVNNEHVTCYFRLVAPPGQQIILHVTTFMTNQTTCDESEAGVFIFDGDETTDISESLCRINDSRRQLELKSSNGTLLVKISQIQNLVVAKMVYGYEETCANSPCLFNGVCVETKYSFKCICPRGTSGRRCDKYTGECYRNPCINGTCYPSVSGSGYKCACKMGFTGTNCEYNINECFSSPCIHGHCIDLANGYKCVCKEHFVGRNCELDKSLALCSRHVCRFGTCAINKTGSYCQCFPGFTGVFCETGINECESFPCAYGTCVDHINGYQCNCSHGYVGKHCEILLYDPCRDNPCHHGYCSVGNDGFSCVCEQGFTGTKCESKLTACYSECFHGYCIKDKTSESKCVCYKKYTGEHCENVLSDCLKGSCASLPNITDSIFHHDKFTTIRITRPTSSFQQSYLTMTPQTQTTHRTENITRRVNWFTYFSNSVHILPRSTTFSPLKTLSNRWSSTTRTVSERTKVTTESTKYKRTNSASTRPTSVTLDSMKTDAPSPLPFRSSTKPTVIVSDNSKFDIFSSRSFTTDNIINLPKTKSRNQTIRVGSKVVTQSTVSFTPEPATTSTEIVFTVEAKPPSKKTELPNIERTTKVNESIGTMKTTVAYTPAQRPTSNGVHPTKTLLTDEETKQPMLKLTTEVTVVSKAHSWPHNNNASKHLATTQVDVPGMTLNTQPTTVSPKSYSTSMKETSTKSKPFLGSTTTSKTSPFQGTSVNDVITIESIVIGALFVVLILVLAMAAFAYHRQAQRGTVYIYSPEPPANTESTSVKKRYSAREIHSELKSGKLFKPRCVSSELYQRQNIARKPKRRYGVQVSAKTSSSTSPESSRSDKYDEVGSYAVKLPKRIHTLVPVDGATSRRSVVNISRGKGVITPPTPEHERAKHSFDSHDTVSLSEIDTSLSSNENPFCKRGDGTVVLNLSGKKTRRTQEEIQYLLEQILDEKDYLTLRRPGMGKSVHYITGAEDGKSEA